MKSHPIPDILKWLKPQMSFDQQNGLVLVSVVAQDWVAVNNIIAQSEFLHLFWPIFLIILTFSDINLNF